MVAIKASNPDARQKLRRCRVPRAAWPARAATGTVTASPPVEALAVLTPRAPWSEDCVALAFGKGDASLAGRCSMLERMADEVRAVLAGSDPARVTVLDRDETLRRVRRMRRPPRCPTAQACDLDTAHLLDAGLVVSARVRTAGESWTARFELRKVAGGLLLASASASGSYGPGVLAETRRASERLVRDSFASRCAVGCAPPPGR